ncbi:sigma-70 family RNA polymerase sigma factor [bacterium]|nr:sigma-70 family RNA polymerase sigma factor [bacterium]
MSSAALQNALPFESAEIDPEVPRLVERCRAGDTEAFEKIFRLHQGRIFAVCLRMTADPDKAESLTQDTFVRSWQKLESYRGDGPFGGWIRRVAVNTVLDFTRRESRQQKRFRNSSSEDETYEQEAMNCGSAEDRIDLERAVASLPEGARTAFVLHDVEGFRHKEIAEMTGLAVGTIKAQLHRARKLLMDRLSDQEGRRDNGTR